MPRLTKLRVKQIQTAVLNWYAKNRRDLPWRTTNDPYRILVSEIMLQQTQVSRVMTKFDEFLRCFPTVNDLAGASRADVIKAWKGLGYNRRALNLHTTAQIVVERFEGQFPQTVEALHALPGIGRYTAGAVLSFAFNRETPAVDTNVQTFIDWAVPTKKYQYLVSEDGELVVLKKVRTESEYYKIAVLLIPQGKARIWLHAVMDYSSLVLKPSLPKAKRKQAVEQFVGSNRYLRGRTLDQLRDQPLTLDELFARVAEPFDINRAHYKKLVTLLLEEGFLEIDGQLIQLHR